MKNLTKETKQVIILALVIVALIVCGIFVGKQDKSVDKTTTATTTVTTTVAEETTTEAPIPEKDIRQAEDGNWYVYNGDEVDTSFSGQASNEYGTWNIENGQVKF
ncbi:MAG: hypothetical protein MJ129_00655 [Clostridia bacterium]|nr:hypothetical protein [Clostridia bacterium]